MIILMIVMWRKWSNDILLIMIMCVLVIIMVMKIIIMK